MKMKRIMVIAMKKENARSKALRITIIYFVVGSLWILLSDKLVQLSFLDQNQVFYYSIVKGLIYILLTSILIFGLTYPAMKKILESKEALRKTNVELEKSNKLYKELYEEYNKKQALLKSMINSIPDLMFYKDTNSVYLGCNAAFETFAGKTEEEIVGLTDADLFPEEEARHYLDMDIEMMKSKMFRKDEEKVIYPNGKTMIFETLKTPYYDSDGSVIGLIGISRDITERKNREDMIQYLSHHDALTGIYNRTHFQKARMALDNAEHLPLSVVVGDVNGMKLINDALGHREGDKLLKMIAGVLTQCSREGDIVTRTGGDEFSILMPNTDSQTAKAVVKRIRALCEEKRQQKDTIFTDIALGYATKNETSDSLDRIMILAEDLMYRRKLLEHKSLHSDILASIKTTMFEKSNETEEHAERISELSKNLGKAMGLSEDKLDELELVSMLHDLGKISIDKNILTKSGKLSDVEWREIKKHPEVGYRIANSTSELSHIAEYILCHHENWDGSGYPLGLAGTNIPLISRIISVVDAYDAMTHDRTYRKALTADMAVEEILSHAGTQFDPEIATLFVEKVLYRQLELFA